MIELWLLISAFCIVLGFCVEDNWQDAAIFGATVLFLPILLPLGGVYCVLSAVMAVAKSK